MCRVGTNDITALPNDVAATMQARGLTRPEGVRPGKGPPAGPESFALTVHTSSVSETPSGFATEPVGGDVAIRSCGCVALRPLQLARAGPLARNSPVRPTREPVLASAGGHPQTTPMLGRATSGAEW